MYDPTDPMAERVLADPLPADLPEGDSGEVTDEGVPEPAFDAYPYGGKPYGGDIPPASSDQETDDDA
jgi:hypothetical protein